MKKSIIAAILAGIMLLSGCSGVSKEDYNSVVAENEKLKSEIDEIKGKNEDEYLSKDYVKRLMNFFTVDGNTNVVDGEAEQYNAKFSQVFTSDKNNDGRGKGVISMKSKNSSQEKAAFCHYYVEDILNQSLGKAIENANDGSEVIIILIDYKGEPFYIWLAYKQNGKSTTDFKYLDKDVLNALNEVKSNPDKWKYVPTDTTSNNGNSQSNNTSTPEQSSPTNSDVLEDYTKDVFTSKASPLNLDTGNEWYYTENLGGLTAVAYVDKYGNLDDNTIVSNAYKDLLDVIIKKPHKGSYFYYWAKENGDVVGAAFSITISGSDPVTMPIMWSGDYSRLNDNATNKTLANAFSSAYGTSE